MDGVSNPALFPLHAQGVEDYSCDAGRAIMVIMPGNMWFGSTFKSMK